MHLIGLVASRVDWGLYAANPDFAVLPDPDENAFCVVDLSRAPSRLILRNQRKRPLIMPPRSDGRALTLRCPARGRRVAQVGLTRAIEHPTCNISVRFVARAGSAYGFSKAPPARRRSGVSRTHPSPRRDTDFP